EKGHRLPDHKVAQGLARMMPADPPEVLGMDSVVGIEVGDQDLAEVEAFFCEHPHHPPAAPVHSGALADDDPRVERVFDVIEAANSAPELLLEPGDILPTALFRLPSDDPDQLQLVRVIGVDDRLDG